MKSGFFVLVLCILAGSVLGQNPKKHVKNGKKQLALEQYTAALADFSQAIKLDSMYTDAYVYRAHVYEKLEQPGKAADDYEKAAGLEPDVVDYLFNAGRLNYLNKKYENALKYISQTVILDNKNVQAWQLKASTQIKLWQYHDAIAAIDNALQFKSTYLGFYTKGVANDSLHNYTYAIENYYRSMELDQDYSPAYFALAKVYLKDKQSDMALEIANQAVERFKDLPEAYETRSRIYHERSNFLRAINDLSKLEIMVENSNDILMLRGKYYFESGQYQNSASDFTQLLSRSDEYPNALYWRARAYEEMMENEIAVRDFTRFLYAESKNATPTLLVKDAKERLYQLSKEDNPPVIRIDSPMITDQNKLGALKNTTQLFIKGKVDDQSELESLTINGDTVPVDQDKLFEYRLNLSNINEVTLMAEDVYGNKTTNSYGFETVELNKPKICITAPYADDDGVIYLDSSDPNLLVEGTIEDESLIKDIFVDGTKAGFNRHELNPGFSATLQILNKDSVAVTAIDQYNNTNKSVFTLNREGSVVSESNPMGKTWVVLIDNSDYEQFPDFVGRARGIDSMKNAFYRYKIHAFIHKKNMTKSQMEQFFSSELGNLVKINNVKSLLIWYSGLGKPANNTSYWIPVDAQDSIEPMYFGMDALKADLQVYTSYLTHILMVSNTCMFNSDFFQVSKGSKMNHSCENADAVNLNSSQIVASQEIDGPKFTKNFISSLNENKKSCLSIDDIVNKMNETYKQNGGEQLQFGRIREFGDENGTFLFIRK